MSGLAQVSLNRLENNVGRHVRIGPYTEYWMFKCDFQNGIQFPAEAAIAVSEYME